MDPILENSAETRKAYLEKLRGDVLKAANNAPEVTIDPETGADSQTLQGMMELRDLLALPGDDITLSFEDNANTIYIGAGEDYADLQLLGLRQILKTNYELTDEELDTEEYQEYYAEWYKQNMEYQQKHEGEHKKGAEEIGMKTRLGIRFIKQEGKIKIVPEIDLEGTANKKQFIDKVIKGVGELSKGDAALLKLMGIE